LYRFFYSGYHAAGISYFLERFGFIGLFLVLLPHPTQFIFYLPFSTIKSHHLIHYHWHADRLSCIFVVPETIMMKWWRDWAPVVTSAASLYKFFVLWCLLLKQQGVFDALADWMVLSASSEDGVGEILTPVVFILVFKAAWVAWLWGELVLAVNINLWLII